MGGGSKVDDGRFGVGALPEPGCLNMPNSMDFLSGRILQDIVCLAFTLTHRTRYDYQNNNQQRATGILAITCHLAMYLELLHACIYPRYRACDHMSEVGMGRELG